MRVVLRIVTVAALVLSLGLHWALLQTIAWTGMLITYAHHGSFHEAIVKTFDGQHPCTLCKAIENGRAEEKRQEKSQLNPSFKLELGPVWRATEFHFACDHEQIPALDSAGLSRADQPPKPPPRGVLPDNCARA